MVHYAWHHKFPLNILKPAKRKTRSKKTWENCRWRVMKCDGWRAANHHKKPPLFSSPHFSPEIALLPQWFTKNIISSKKTAFLSSLLLQQYFFLKKIAFKKFDPNPNYPPKKEVRKIWISKFCVDIGGFLGKCSWGYFWRINSLQKKQPCSLPTQSFFSRETSLIKCCLHRPRSHLRLFFPVWPFFSFISFQQRRPASSAFFSDSLSLSPPSIFLRDNYSSLSGLLPSSTDHFSLNVFPTKEPR